MGRYTQGSVLALGTHSVLVVEGDTSVGLIFSPASSVPAGRDAGHEAVAEGVRKTPHHVAHPFAVCAERIANTQSEKQKHERVICVTRQNERHSYAGIRNRRQMD